MLGRRFEHVTPQFLTFSVCKFIARLFKKLQISRITSRQTNECLVFGRHIAKKTSKKVEAQARFLF